jgi:hypothetical protein
VAFVQHHQLTVAARHERFVRYPRRATVQKAAHGRETADQVDRLAGPALLVSVVVGVFVPLAALLVLLASGVAHFS